MEDNNEVEDNDDNNLKDISALGLDRDLGFLRGHQGHQPPDDDDKEDEPKLAQISRKLTQIRANLLKPEQICTNSHRFAQTRAESRKLAQIRANLRRFAQTRADSHSFSKTRTLLIL